MDPLVFRQMVVNHARQAHGVDVSYVSQVWIEECMKLGMTPLQVGDQAAQGAMRIAHRPPTSNQSIFTDFGSWLTRILAKYPKDTQVGIKAVGGAVLLGGFILFGGIMIHNYRRESAETARAESARRLAEDKEALRRSVEQGRQEAARRVAKEAEEAQKARDYERARNDPNFLGPEPPTLADGVPLEAAVFLSVTLKDPSSISFSYVGPWRYTRDNKWTKRIGFRAKNSFGATVLNHLELVYKGDKLLESESRVLP